MKLFRAIYSAFKTGDFIKEIRIINQNHLDSFSQLTGDHNKIHKANNGSSFVHGAFLNCIMAGIIGTKLPGNGSIVLSQNFSFPAKCVVNEPIEFHVELVDVRKIIKVKYKCTQNKSTVFEGDAKLIIKEN